MRGECLGRLKRLTSQGQGISQEARSHSQYLDTMALNLLPGKQDTALDNAMPAPEGKMIGAAKDVQSFTLAPFDQNEQEGLDHQVNSKHQT